MLGISYNGWASWETWNAYNWLTSREDIYNLVNSSKTIQEFRDYVLVILASPYVTDDIDPAHIDFMELFLAFDGGVC